MPSTSVSASGPAKPYSVSHGPGGATGGGGCDGGAGGATGDGGGGGSAGGRPPAGSRYAQRPGSDCVLSDPSLR